MQNRLFNYSTKCVQKVEKLLKFFEKASKSLKLVAAKSSEGKIAKLSSR